MQETSEKYNSLNNRIHQIIEHYAGDFKDKKIEQMNEKEIDLCRGLRVLCHAELEVYFEETALFIIKQSLNKWKDKIPTIPLVALCLNSTKIEAQRDLDTNIYKIIVDYEKNTVNQNHGIKIDNLKKMFASIGLNFNNLDNVWLSLINSYGKFRGETAHTAAITQQPINIKEEITNLERILIGIKNFEKELRETFNIDIT